MRDRSELPRKHCSRSAGSSYTSEPRQLTDDPLVRGSSQGVHPMPLVRLHAHPASGVEQTSVESVAGQGWRSAADQKTRVRSANVTNSTPFHVANETSGPAAAQPAMESAVPNGTPNPSARSPVVRVR